jgi:hypothetical protein
MTPFDPYVLIIMDIGDCGSPRVTVYELATLHVRCKCVRFIILI